MIEFVRLENQNQGLWNRYALSNSDSEIYHLASWADVYSETYGYKPYFFLLKLNDKVVGLLPIIHQKGFCKNILTSLPGGILLDNHQSHGEDVYHFIIALKNKLQAKDVVLYNRYRLSCEMFESTENIRILKNLPKDDIELLNEIGKKRRWGIRKAQEHGLTHQVFRPTKDLIKTFHQIYAKHYRDLGTPVHSLLFFLKQAEHLGDYIRILFVWKDDTPICVKWLMHYKSAIISSESATLKEYYFTRVSDYQVFHALKYAIDNSCSTYNMGRSQIDTGAFNFKKSWGELDIEEYPIFSSKLRSGIGAKKKKFNLFINLWKKMPVPLTKLVGPILRKHLSLD